MVRLETITRECLADIIELCRAEGWTSYMEDPEVTWRALTAPGVTTIVARDGNEVVGFAQILSDGQIQAHLSLVVVARNRRREGIGRCLVQEALSRSGARRADLLADEDVHGFYLSLRHKQMPGFRIYPEDPEPRGDRRRDGR
jgi:ribosomal protein S18 acetylase RimI-like enzyme